MALTHSEGDLLRKLSFCLVKDRLTLQQKTSGIRLIKYLEEVFLPDMTALFSLPSGCNCLRNKMMVLHVYFAS